MLFSFAQKNGWFVGFEAFSEVFVGAVSAFSGSKIGYLITVVCDSCNQHAADAQMSVY